MSLTTTKKILAKALDNNYAVCAFNAENMEMIQAIASAAEELFAPVIIQTTPSTLKYSSAEYFAAMVTVAAKNAKIPIALHLDHGDSFELVVKAIRAGYTSVMIDGSQKSFDDNVKITNKVIELCRALNISVEAELGKVGGKEDDLDGGDAGYTNVDDAVKFVTLTDCDSLAIGIGTSHGFYSGPPKLDLDRLSTIKSLVNKPIVLHGGTGLSDETIKECVLRGINKANFATELRATYTSAVRETLKDESIIDVKVYGKFAREKTKQLVMNKIKLSGSAGMA